MSEPPTGPGGRSVQVSAARAVVALRRDPCPGDVGGVRDLTASLRRSAAACDSGAVAAAGWEPVAWRDEVAHATARHVGALVTGARDLRRSLGHAADALDRWAAALGDLQAEADGLDREAVDNRRRRAELDVTARDLVLDPMAGLDTRRAAQQQLLDSDLARVQARADELHLRWVALSYAHAADLDAAALPGAGPGSRWRSTWDSGHDVMTYGVRLAAPVVAAQADATGTAAALAGAVAAFPPAAAVAGPLAAGLGAAELLQRTVLAVGVGGSAAPVLTAAAGAIPGAGSVLGQGARAGATAARAGTPAAREGPSGARVPSRTGDPVDPAVEGTSLGTGLLLDAWSPEHTGATTTATVVAAGGQVDVTVHDVAEPWDTATGLPLRDRADDFAGVAVLTVPAGVLRTPARGRPDAPPPAPRPAPPRDGGPARLPGPAAPQPTRSDERHDQDGVGGRGR